MKLSSLEKDIKGLINQDKANIYQSFFKTGPGQYGAGDLFLGITVPSCRLLAKKYQSLSFNYLEKLLSSPYHEKRLIALLILIEKYQLADDREELRIINFYLKNKQAVNNWDLVDLSAYKLLGDYLLKKPKKRKILYHLVKDPSLWSRRIAIVATYAFIKKNQLNDSFKIAQLLINDQEDLIHKASGWILREAGKKDKIRLLNFLKNWAKFMPRSMLRYSIEKFTVKERSYWLKSSFKRKRP